MAATFDPLDAALGDAFDWYQTLPDDVRCNVYTRHIIADPAFWERHEPPEWVFQLQWTEYRYSAVTTQAQLDALIPSTDPGIYLFSIKPNRLIQGFPHLVMYAGISNERDSNRPLRERLGDYLPSKMSVIRKRNNIHKLLRLYYNQVWVTCANSTKPSAELSAAEQKLHGYFYLPAGERDFPPEIKANKPAF